MPEITYEPLRNFGMEVVGLDLDQPIDPATAGELYNAWLRHGVLLFRKAGTSADIHLALSRVFGTLEEHVVKQILVKDTPELIFLGSEGDERGPATIIDGEKRAGFIFFHHDTNYGPTMPKGAVLRMVRVPENGGDTVWTDTIRAYEALPDHVKARIETLETLQSACGGLPLRGRLWGWAGHSASHANDLHLAVISPSTRAMRTEPMVVVHPETGRKGLNLSPLNFVRVLGMEEAEGDALYDEVVGIALRPEFSYRHKWSEYDMVVWDNRRTMHCGMGYPYEQKRFAYRTTLGEPMPIGALYEDA